MSAHARHVTRLAADLIGHELFSASGASLGRVVAVIHRARGADVLVEQWRWLRRRSRRFRLDELEQQDDGRLVVGPLVAVHDPVAFLRRDEVARR